MALKALALAAKVKRLFWIDDRFGRSSRLVARAISTKIETLWGLDSNAHLNHPSLRTLPLGSDPEALESSVVSILNSSKDQGALSEELIRSLDNQIATKDSTHKPDIKDLSFAQFEDIQAAFKAADVTVRTLSYDQWIDQKAEILGDLKSSDLFFVDHDFSYEEGGSATTGENILKELLQHSEQHFTCILFTHGAGVDQEDVTHAQIVEAATLEPFKHRFSVISKESLSSMDIPNGYAALTRAFKRAFLRDWCCAIAEQSRHAFDESIKDTKDVLLNLSTEDLASAFFRKPFSDGTLEADVILRIILLAARIKLESKRPANSWLWQRLAAIRSVLAIPPTDVVKQKHNQTLQTWYQRELFDPSEVVNATFSPVFLGDVFQVTRNEKSEHFVLVGQPCDLMIRDTGERRNTEALFLPMTDRPPKKDVFGYEFDLPGLGTRWIRYGDAFAVNLNLLDIISFRSDGKMIFDLDVKGSELMLPGLVRKLELLSNSFRELCNPNRQNGKGQLNKKYVRLALSGLPCLETIVENSRIVFPIARIGRIRSPHAEAILGGLAVHNTRVAFEYNFANLSDYYKDPDLSPDQRKVADSR